MSKLKKTMQAYLATAPNQSPARTAIAPATPAPQPAPVAPFAVAPRTSVIIDLKYEVAGLEIRAVAEPLGPKVGPPTMKEVIEVPGWPVTSPHDIQ